MTPVVMSDSNLTYANLAGARLDHATLVRVNFRGAVLVGATLYHAHLESVDFTLADLSRAELGGARHDANTRWPDGFDPLEHGAIRL
jgi:uncharacterized protein YjbI with pentapeptide repeats